MNIRQLVEDAKTHCNAIPIQVNVDTGVISEGIGRSNYRHLREHTKLGAVLGNKH
jgi:hypothetical protein